MQKLYFFKILSKFSRKLREKFRKFWKYGFVGVRSASENIQKLVEKSTETRKNLKIFMNLAKFYLKRLIKINAFDWVLKIFNKSNRNWNPAASFCAIGRENRLTKAAFVLTLHIDDGLHLGEERWQVLADVVQHETPILADEVNVSKVEGLHTS